MRTNKNTFDSLNDAVKQVVSPTNDHLDEKTINEQPEDNLPDINNIKDSEIADYIIRYNQVVNRALRARFMSKTKRKAV